MLSKTKKRKYDKLKEADFKVLKEEKLEKPVKKTQQVIKASPKKHKMDEEETKIEDKAASDSDKYDTEFEDDFDDEYEDEEIVEENPTFIENPMPSEGLKPKKKVEFEKIEEEEKYDNGNCEKTVVKPFLGNSKNLKKDEFLDFDNKAYEMLHRANTEWPCLSFDVLLPDYQNYNFRAPSFEKMEKYPYTAYLVAGTQTQSFKNFIYMLKLDKLHKTKYDDDSEEDSEGEDSSPEQEADIFLSSIEIKHSINRLKAMQHSPIVATWNENCEVSIYNLQDKFAQLQAKSSETAKNKTLKEKKKKTKNYLTKSFKHSTEGFALGWSPLKKGLLASGSMDRKIFLYQSVDENMSDFLRQENPYVFHDASVEDIQFSPVEDFVFASCSVDKTIRICDTRENKYTKSQITLHAHDTDVNVITWNSLKSYLLASGADDGCFKIWDLRYDKTCMTELLWHTESITSIAFQPNEESVLAVSSADNRISLWDFAVEPDDEAEKDEEIPDQLMFLHQGQEDVKEIGFHPLYWEMMISTSNTGFHLFKPNLTDGEAEGEGENEEDEKNIPKIREEELDKYLEKMSLN